MTKSKTIYFDKQRDCVRFGLTALSSAIIVKKQRIKNWAL